MLFLLLLLSGVAVGAIYHPALMQHGGCPLYWYGYNGRCFRYVATPLSWADAEFNCLLLRGNLVSIHSPWEDNFVRHLIYNFDRSGKPAWIGLTDIHKEGMWMWSDGSAARVFFWFHGEPNNSHENEHCGHTNFHWKWNDELCSRKFPSVCVTRRHY